MSNESLVSLSEISARNCDPSSIQGLSGPLYEYISKEMNTAWMVLGNETYGGMSECCAPNPINVYQNCTLWCELPDSFMELNNESGDGDMSHQFYGCLRGTGMNMSVVRTLAASKAEKGAAVHSTRRPNLMTLGTLLLLSVGLLAFKD